MSSSSLPTSHTTLLPSHHLLPLPTSSSTSLLPREYRKGNWTLHETLVLITAKRLDDERRALSPKLNPTNDPSSSANTSPPLQCGGGRSAELRWKWVENYCWRNGCLRSQNQCNDKWDNLLRDYKKVRHYQMKLVKVPKECENEGVGTSGGSDLPPDNNDGSYWKMEKHERKERNLPANLVAEVFNALTDVLNRRNTGKGGQHHNVIGGSNSNSNCNPLQLPISPRRQSMSKMPIIIASTVPVPAVPPSSSTSTLPAVSPLPLSTIRTPTLVPPMKTHPPEPSVPETSTTESSGTEKSTESGKKKRRKKLGHMGSSLIKGASMLATALLACEEKREKRHREVMELEERRLKMDSERTDSARQDMIGLITAVHTLSGTLHGFISDNSKLRRRSDIDGDEHDDDNNNR